MLPEIEKIDKPTLQKTLEQVYLCLSNNEAIPESQTNVAVFSGLFMILKSAVRHRVKPEVLQSLLTEMKLPASVIPTIVSVFKKTFAELEAVLADFRPRFAALSDVKWRIDVTISTSSMTRVLKPSIMIQLTLSDGTIKQFNMSIEQFHSFRYSVARSLKDMQDLERQPILKIDK